MKGSVCLLEFKKIDTKWKLHGLWVTLKFSRIEVNSIWVQKKQGVFSFTASLVTPAT